MQSLVGINWKTKVRMDKPVCKYGSSCYRRNPAHLRQFSHPGRDGKEAGAAPGSVRASKRSPPVVDSPRLEITDYFSSKHPEPSSSSIDVPPSKKLRTEATDVGGLPAEEQDDQSTTAKSSGGGSDVDSSLESSDVKENIKRQFLVDMPDDFYLFWEWCSTINPSRPEVALEPALGLELVGPYHVLAGKLRRVPWEKCVLHYRYYYDPPELQTVVKTVGDDSDGFHIGYFRDDPKSAKCLVVSNCAKKSCEINIEGENMFSAVRHQLSELLKDKWLMSARRDKLQDLSSKLTSFMSERGIKATPAVKDLWKQRRKEIVADCFHKIGISVPYDEDTDVGYRPLSMSNRELKKLLNQITNCQDESKRDQLFEPLQELVTYVQFANDECDYGMGLELGLDLFCHGHQYLHSLITHLLPIAYDLLHREEWGKVCAEHLQHRCTDPLDFTHT